MNEEYITKVLEQDLEKMSLNELIGYLCFLQTNQFLLSQNSETYPFKNKYYDVVQFIESNFIKIEKERSAKFNNYLNIVESKKDSINQLKKLTSDFEEQLRLIEKIESLTERLNLQRRLCIKFSKRANNTIQDLFFVPEDFMPDEKIKKEV